MKRIKITQKGLILVLAPFIMPLFCICILAYLLDQSGKEAENDAHSKQLIKCAETIDRCGRLSSGAAIVYVGPSQLESHLQAYQSAMREVRSAFRKLTKLTENEPAKQAAVKHIEMLFTSGSKICDGSIESIRKGETINDLASISGVRAHLFALYSQISDEVQQFVETEKTAGIESRKLSKALRVKGKNFILAGIAVSILISLLELLLFTKGVSGRLAIILDNTKRFSKGEKLKPILDGYDEISELDRTFHTMANALKESRHKERAVINNAVDILCTLDQNLLLNAVNPASIRVWGYSPEELEGRSLIDIIASEDADTTYVIFEELRSDALDDTTFDCRIRHKDGGIVYSSWSVDWSAARQSFFCVVYDITQRKRNESLLRESEARARVIVESLPLGLIITTDDGKLEVANRAAERLLCFRENELIGKSVRTMLEIDDQKPANSSVSASPFDRPRRSSQLDVISDDGIKLKVELSQTELTLSEEKKNLFVLTDISQRVRVEKMKGDFIAMVSHDLLTALSTIYGSLELFSNGIGGVLNKKGNELLKVCEKETTRLITLVNNLLDVERLQSGTMEVKKELADFGSIVSQAVTSVAYLAETNDVRIVNNVQAIEGYIDSGSLVQVMINLLANAIKFSPAGSTITIELIEKTDSIEVRVVDQGCGIPPRLREAIFDRFKQVNTSDRTRKGGSGLGLAICKAIIEAHGGSIGVTGNADGGSTFWWSIPWGERARQ